MEMVDDAAEAMADQPGDPAVEVAREFARAEWRMWSTFLDLHEHEVDAINDSDAPPLVRQVELSFIPNELAQRVHWSEARTPNRSNVGSAFPRVT